MVFLPWDRGLDVGIVSCEISIIYTIYTTSVFQDPDTVKGTSELGSSAAYYQACRHWESPTQSLLPKETRLGRDASRPQYVVEEMSKHTYIDMWMRNLATL